jgi:hypothetical protein
MRFGFTGNIVAPNGWSTRLRSKVRPTLPGFSEAPTTATVLGWKIAFSDGRDAKTN